MTPVRVLEESAAAGSLDHGDIARRAARSLLWLAGGQGLLFLIGLLGGILLARLLSPRDFGIYAVTIFVVLKLRASSELGLNVRLIHDEQPSSDAQQRSVFTLHLLVAIAAYAVVYLLAPWLAAVFQLGSGGAAFFRLVGASILIHPLSIVPAALLARRLAYDRVALGDLVSGIVYQTAAVALAFGGFSFWSFGLASLLSDVVRVLVLNVLAPWRVGLAWDGPYLRRSLHFGGAFHLASLTAIPRDNIISLLAGPLYGPTSVGLLSWSQRLASTCSETWIGICARIAFPSLSRVRSAPEVFAAALAKMVRYASLATCLSLSVVAALVPEIVHLVFTDKWAPAIPLFYWFAIRMVAANYTTLVDSALRAQGHPGRALRVLSLWTALEWALALLGAALLGQAGIAVASAVAIWFGVVWLHRELSRVVSFSLVRAGVVPVLCGAFTFLVLQLGKGTAIHSLPRLGAAAAVGTVVYIAAGLLLEGRRFALDIKADLGVLTGGHRQARPAGVGS